MSITNPDNVVTKQDLADFYQNLLPYLGGMPEFVNNKISRSDIYSTTEKIVGQWIDGKPIYQKTFTGTWSTTAPEAKTFTIPSNIEIIDIKGVSRWYASSSEYGYQPIPWWNVSKSGSVNIDYAVVVYTQANSLYVSRQIGGSAFNSQPFKITIQYTKTTDSAISVGSETDYSTTEKIIGTWIDGKPLYQRTLTGTTSASSGTSISVNTGITGGSNARVINGYAIVTSDGTTYDIPMPYAISNTNYGYISITSNGATLFVQTTLTSAPFVVTIQYTKS